MHRLRNANPNKLQKQSDSKSAVDGILAHPCARAAAPAHTRAQARACERLRRERWDEFPNLAGNV